MNPDTPSPTLPAVAWCNTSHTPSWPRQAQVPLLLHFWDSLCPDCISRLAVLRGWHRGYAQLGLQLIGVHRAAYAFTREPNYLEQTSRRLGLRWPQAVDQPGAVWPAEPTAGKHGCLLLRPDGSTAAELAPPSGDYTKFEQEIHSLWGELDPEINLPAIEPVGAEQAGRGTTSSRPPVLAADAGHVPDALELHGHWQAQGDSYLLRDGAGTVALPNPAGPVWAVLSPEAESPTEPSILAQLSLDGAVSEQAVFGADVFHGSGGPALRVSAPRLYHILRDPGGAADALRLRAGGPGLRFYAWLFGPCLP